MGSNGTCCLSSLRLFPGLIWRWKEGSSRAPRHIERLPLSDDFVEGRQGNTAPVAHSQCIVLCRRLCCFSIVQNCSVYENKPNGTVLCSSLKLLELLKILDLARGSILGPHLPLWSPPHHNAMLSTVMVRRVFVMLCTKCGTPKEYWRVALLRMGLHSP